MRDIRVAAVSMENWVGEIDRSIERISQWTERAAESGAELVMFPEMSVGGWHIHDRMGEYAQPVPGPISDQIQTIARRHGCIIAYGMVERDKGRYHNAQVLVDGDRLCFVQRKLHLPINEAAGCDAGERVDVVDIGKARIGIALCRDAFFPSTYRALYKMGAEIVLMPLAYSTMPRAQYVNEHVHASVMRSMCWIYGMYGVFANSAGIRAANQYSEHELAFPGWAGAFSPLGELLSYTFQGGNDEQMIIVDLKGDLLDARRENPHFIGKDDCAL